MPTTCASCSPPTSPRVVTPALVVASVGATGTGAIDPVREFAAIAHEYGAWLHVDGAWAGVAAVAPELRWLNDGFDDVDSYCTNPHKWLLTNFDCDAFWVADRAALIGALSILPEYLRNAASESGAVIDYRDWQVPLGRRFRALKLWAVIRWYGAEGLRAHIRKHVALAQEFASWVAADERFELVAPHPLALVTFRAARRRRRDPRADGPRERLRRAVPHPHAGERQVALRLAIGATLTERRHVEAAWAALSAAVTASSAQLADADHALLHDADQMRAVAGEEPPGRQAAAADAAGDFMT